MNGKRVWLAIALAAMMILAGCVGDDEKNEKDGNQKERKGDGDGDREDPDERTLEEVKSIGENAIQAFVENLSVAGDVDMIQGSFTNTADSGETEEIPDQIDFWARFGEGGGSRQQLDALPYFQTTIYCFSGGMIYELDGDYDSDDLGGVPEPGAYEARSPDEACDTSESFGDGFWRNGFMIQGIRFAQSEAEGMKFTSNGTDLETDQLVLQYDEVDWRGETVGNLTARIDLKDLRLNSLSAQYDEGVDVSFEVEYGDRMALGRPSMDVVRLPAYVEGHEDNNHNYHYYIDAPMGEGVSLDEFQVRFYDPADPDEGVVFDPADPSQQNEGEWHFTYFDEDGDGTMNAGDRFEIMPDWNYNYGGEAYPYEEYYEHKALIWDEWADAPVSAEAPGPGMAVFFVLLLFGGLVGRRIHRREDRSA